MKKNKNTTTSGDRLVTGAIASSLGASLGKIPIALSGELREHAMGEGTANVPKASEKVLKQFQKLHKIENVNINQFGSSPHFTPEGFGGGKGGTAHINPNSLPVSLHELGHASNMRKATKAKMILQVASRAGSPLLGLGLLSSDKTDQYAAPATMAGFTPMLVEEANASRKAINFIKKTDPNAYKASAKVLAKAFGTYGLMALGTTGGIYGAYRFNKNKKTKK